MTVRDYAGAAPRTALSVTISNSATSFTVVSGGGTGYPTGAGGNFYVALDAGLAGEEKILCSSRTGDVFTVATGGRGADDTTAAAHNNGATVDHVGTATDLREANAHVNATSGVHGRTGSLVGTTDTQTLSNKTLTTPTIGSFTNAQHDHTNAAGGGTLSTSAGLSAAVSSTVLTDESTASTSYTALATAHTVSVTVPSSGRVLVMLSAAMATTGGGGNYAVALSGANTAAATPDRALNLEGNANTSGVYFPAHNSFMLTGLTPGVTVFTMQAQASTGTLSARRRSLTVTPA